MPVEARLGIDRKRPQMRIAARHLCFLQDSPADPQAVVHEWKTGSEMGREVISGPSREIPPIVESRSDLANQGGNSRPHLDGQAMNILGTTVPGGAERSRHNG